MKPTTSHLLAMAATLALGSGVYAQNAGAPTDGDRPNATDRAAADNRAADEKRSPTGPGNTTDNMGGTPAERADRSNAADRAADEKRSPTGPGNTTDNMGGTPAERAGTGNANDRDTNRDMNRTGTGGADAGISQQLSQIRSEPENAGAKLFVLHTGMHNLHEVRLSELAARKSKDAQVKELAQQMVKDHNAANEQLRPIAQKMNVTIPNDLPAAKQQKLAILEQLPEDEFNKAYLGCMKVGHASAITDFAVHEQMVKDDQLKQYITQMLPKLRQHGEHTVRVAQAKGLSGDLVAVGGSGSNTAAKTGTNLTGEGRE